MTLRGKLMEIVAGEQSEPRSLSDDFPRFVRQYPASGSRRDETASMRAPVSGSDGRLVAMSDTIPQRAGRELVAMHAVLAELTPLTRDERERVIAWVQSVIAGAEATGDMPIEGEN